ncbi:MAG: restriction endonuclease subunit S [Bacteroidetes bacterium]|nr:restriction endonuclease subunit S [Bacteroidota bacterium]
MNKLVKLSELFEPKYGVNLELINLDQCNSTEKGAVPFVSRTEKNNGVSAFVYEMSTIELNPAHTLSVAVSGSVLSTFYQPKPYYSGRDLYVLIPKKNFSPIEMLFYAKYISSNKYRYNYGRQANKTLRDILLPESTPNRLISHLDLFKSEIEKKIIEKPVSSQKVELNTCNWKWYFLDDIFHYEKGVRLTKETREKGTIPLVTAGKEKEGVAENVANEEMIRYSNAVTIDMFGNSFYRQYPFCCDDNILVLKPKIGSFSKYIGLFMASVLNIDTYKCAYGRQYRQKTFVRHKIKLPAMSNGLPDWQFMEDYIKSLYYSQLI